MTEKEIVQEENLQEEKTLEQMFAELEDVIATMEGTETSLEEAFRFYHKGMDILKSCNDKIDRVEKQMLVLDSEGEVHEFED